MYIQEISKELNMSRKAIHVYEEKGIIFPKRDTLGYRVYTDEDKQTLLKVKQLRNLDFTVQEIKEVLIDKNYQIFDIKKDEYQKKMYDLETSVQFIDDVKECIITSKDITSIAQDLDDIFALKKVTPVKNLSIDFDKVIMCLTVFGFCFALKAENNEIFEIIACLCFGLILALYYSSQLRLFIFHLLEKFQK
ncbi:MerR family transcriptional regulator [Candidatus Stoquefichus massiliensis]|uniref:MerR family transcriptional regulator n=1 Tax=Candidatus Stoquefichus massiliensis TaxID=1470350 RepID=UPI000487329F|nr:MerR family transcriptional regulator [Candidatus Stoquefichus massiliensis]